MPPWKLKRANSGISQTIGVPRMKNRTTGAMTMAPMLVKKTGRILPVLSCSFLA